MGGKVRAEPSIERSGHNPPSRRWRYNDKYDLHRGFAFKDVKGRWRTPDGTRWVSERSAISINRYRLELVRAIDLRKAALQQGRELSMPQAARAAAQGRGDHSRQGRERIIEYAVDHYDLDGSELFDDYYNDDTP